MPADLYQGKRVGTSWGWKRVFSVCCGCCWQARKNKQQGLLKAQNETCSLWCGPFLAAATPRIGTFTGPSPPSSFRDAHILSGSDTGYDVHWSTGIPVFLHHAKSGGIRKEQERSGRKGKCKNLFYACFCDRQKLSMDICASSDMPILPDPNPPLKAIFWVCCPMLTMTGNAIIWYHELQSHWINLPGAWPELLFCQ